MFGFDVKIAKIVWTGLLVLLALYVVYSIRQTLLIVTFAIFFSYLIYPLVGYAERLSPRAVPRTALIGLIFGLVFVVLAIAVSVLGSRLADEAAKLSEQLPNLLSVKNISERIPLPHVLEPLREKLVSFLNDQLQNNAGQAVPFAEKMGLHVIHAASNLIYLVLIPVLSFLLIKEAPAMKEKLLISLGGSNTSLWARIIYNLDILMAGYVRALLILSIATFLVYSIVFSLMGLSYALLLGALAGLLEVIPFIGPLIGVAVIMLVSLFTGYEHVFWLSAFIVAYRLFQDYVLNPYLMNAGVEVPPLLVILGLLAGEQLGGVAGIFLAVPVVAGLRIILGEVSSPSAPAVRD